MSFSMKGSGIYSDDLTLDIDCQECDNTWTETLATDDWGHINAEVQCPVCDHEFTYRQEAEDIYGEDPDRAHDEMGEW